MTNYNHLELVSSRCSLFHSNNIEYLNIYLIIFSDRMDDLDLCLIGADASGMCPGKSDRLRKLLMDECPTPLPGTSLINHILCISSDSNLFYCRN